MNTMVKKILLILGFAITFVAGVAVSDVVLHTINSVLDKKVFQTRIDLATRLDESERKLTELQDRLDMSEQTKDDLSEQMKQKREEMKKLAAEIENNITPTVIKDALLTTPSTGSGETAQIFLNPKTGETLLAPATTDDPTVAEFKKTVNKKAKEIIDTSKSILGEKISRLNQETIRMNNELQDKNMELIQKLKEVEKYKKELEENKEQIKNLEGIKVDLEKTVGILETKIESGRLRVSFKGDILFDSGKHKLRDEGVKLLESVYPILQRSSEKNDIFIAGHTDNVRIKAKTDKYESNWDLSTYRAIEVVKYLISKGMNPRNLTAAGYGEFKPIASNDSKEGRSQNRRVEIFLIPKIIKRNN